MADYTNPNAPTIQNPLNLDLAIKEVQDQLVMIPWLDVAYGRVWNRVSEEDGMKDMQPHLYVGNGQYQIMKGNDNLKAFCFFYPYGPERVKNFEQNTGSLNKERDVAIIFWIDLRKIDPSKDEVFLEELKTDIEAQLLKSIPVKNILRIWDDKPTEIYKGFNVDELDQSLLIYPYKGIRYDCELSFETFCQ